MFKIRIKDNNAADLLNWVSTLHHKEGDVTMIFENDRVTFSLNKDLLNIGCELVGDADKIKVSLVDFLSRFPVHNKKINTIVILVEDGQFKLYQYYATTDIIHLEKHVEEEMKLNTCTGTIMGQYIY